MCGDGIGVSGLGSALVTQNPLTPDGKELYMIDCTQKLSIQL